MKKLSIILFFVSFSCNAFSQNESIHEFLAHVDTTSDMKAKVDLLTDRRFLYSNPDSSFAFGQRGFRLARANNYTDGEFKSHAAIAFSAWAMGDFETTIKLGHKVQEYALSNNDTSLFILSMYILLHGYRDQGDFREALKLTFESDKSDNAARNSVPDFYSFVASCYYGLEKYDSALYYLDLNRKLTNEKESGWSLLMRGRTFEKLNDDTAAFDCYKQSILKLQHNYKDLAGAYIGLASLFNKMELADTAVIYAKEGLKIAQGRNFNKEKAEAYSILSSIYENIDINEALNYLKLANTASNNLFNQEKQRRITSFRFNEELRQQEIRAAELEFKNKNQRLWIFSISSALLFSLLLALTLYRNNTNKQKAKQKIELAYDRLKLTQAQLIQSEKMASLGKLTAGIAHEIENPLNFVNNFSDVNKELLEELKEEATKGNLEEVKLIATEIIENEQKINNHGKRADAIVKGMLMHSGSNSGKREPTDINALCNEYLRLSYHGFCAKDKSFNADYRLNADKSLPKVEVVPQDIGRVLLNLINNAFYAVSIRQKTLTGVETPSGLDYKPAVTVTTKNLDDHIEISVKDNGPGIPEKIKEKIFQPFFTTKPSGQGTGLGLSMAYDIVKVHGGELQLERLQDKGSSFKIILPITSQ